MPDPSSDDATIVEHGVVRRPIGARILRWIAILLIVLLALAGLVLVGVNSDRGRRFVAGRIAGLEFSNGLKIGVGRIDGSLYGKLTLRQLTLSDTKGVFLSAPEVQVDWRPFSFVGNHIDVRSARASTMLFARLPQFKVGPPTDAPLLPDYDIDIGRLTVDRLVVAPAVAGRGQVASIDGRAHVADRRAQVVLKAGAVGGDRLDLALDAVPEANRLGLRLALDSPADGVVTKLAGLKVPLALRIAGHGDWKKWDGRLDADLDRSPFARLALTARNGSFGVRGPTKVARLVTGPTAALLGPITTLDLHSTWQNRRAVIDGRIASDAFTLDTSGAANLARNRFDDLRLAFVLLKPGAIAPNLSGRNVAATVRLSGAFATPLADYRVTADTLAFNDMALNGLVALGSATIGKDHVTVPIAARAARITGLDVVAGGSLANVRLDGDLAVDWPRILSDNLSIRSDRIDAKLVVLADVAKGFYTGVVDGRIDRYRVESVGLFNLITRADVKTLAGGGYGMVGRIRARSTQLFNSGVRSFLGGNMLISSDLAYGRDGLIRFSKLRLAAPLLTVSDGRGSYAPSGAIDLRAVGRSVKYGPVAVVVAGTLTNPHAIVTATRPGLGLGIAGLRADIRAVGKAYHVLASGGTDYGPFTADVLVDSSAGPLDIRVTRATLAGIGVHGRVRQSAAGPYLGRLDAAGQGLGGVVRLGAAGIYQAAIINLRARDTVLPGPAKLSVGSAIVDARVILSTPMAVVADVQVARTRYAGYDLNAARAVIDYRGGRGTARIFAEGNSGAPFRVAINSELQPGLWRAALRGRVSGVDVHTLSPARIIPRRGGYELLPTALAFDQGSVRLAGTYGPGLTLHSRIERLDMAILNGLYPGLGVNGNAVGSVDFEQASATSLPRADIRLAIRNFTRTTAALVSQPVDINFLGQLAPGHGDVRAVMRTRGTVIGRLQASLAPLGPGAGSWTKRIMGAPVNGGLRYIGPADTLFSFAGLSGQQLTGALGVAADFSCRVSQPCLQGVVRGKGLTYDNVAYGTRLTEMALAGRFTGDKLQIEQLTAKAGSGTVTGKGSISLAAASGYPANIDLKLDNARLANSSELRASATGAVRLLKPAGQIPVLSGTVLLPSSRYQIVRQTSAAVPELTGVRFKPPRGPVRINGDAPKDSASTGFGNVGLDLKIRAPRQLFVSGMGLESEWGADLAVTGTNLAPRISGRLTLVRGTLDFGGRSFTLGDSQVTFNGGGATDATIALRATSTVEDVDVTIAVSGSAANPQVTFSSTPGLPQDEILSRVLFGSSISNLSAIQAVQLASSLNSLRGSGGGLNPLGKLRAATGFDRLRVLGADKASGRGTSLAAGKYISNNIYLEVVTDARGFTATQLEVTLSRVLSVLSQAGGSNSTSINVRYRKNY
jgi:translocation and assembly module TamB